MNRTSSARRDVCAAVRRWPMSLVVTRAACYAARVSYRAVSRALLLATALHLGCSKQPGETGEDVPPRDQPPGVSVLLEGSFRAAAKTGSGKARIVRKGTGYQLHLEAVTTSGARPIHVYLVGLPNANTTRAVQETDTKYDFGPLAEGGTQVIDLPSEPAAEIRSVVLYNPRFGVNLAWAPLTPP